MVVPDRINIQGLCSESVEVDPGLLAYTPGPLKTQEMCDKATTQNPDTLRFIPDHLKTHKMCNEVMRTMPNAFHLIPDHFKTQGMCTKAIEVNPWQLYYVPDHFKTQELCNDAVQEEPFSLQYLPDYFVTQKQLKIWHDKDDYCKDDELIEWYEGHQKRKAHKAKIKEEVLPTAWHSDRVMDWCMSEDEEKQIEKLGKQQIVFFKLSETKIITLWQILTSLGS